MNNKFSTTEKSQKILATLEDTPKQPFVEPKLRFIEPKLVKQGKLENVTASFFTVFSP